MAEVQDSVPAEVSSEIRTLFLSNLPDDATEREVYLLCRTLEGFEQAQVKQVPRSVQPVAFVIFNSPADATAARDVLDGVVFDPEYNTTIRASMARANSKLRVRVIKDPSERVDKRPRLSGFGGVPSYASGGSNAAFSDQLNNYVSGGMASTLPARGVVTGYLGDPMNTILGGSMGAAPVGYNNSLGGGSMGPMPPAPAPGAPCSTLHVANLSTATTEADLVDIFSRLVGFKRLRLLSGNNPTSFVEFEDENMSTSAMREMQGYQMRTSLPGGLRIEYARSRMKQQRM